MYSILPLGSCLTGSQSQAYAFAGFGDTSSKVSDAPVRARATAMVLREGIGL